jgi:hypothetical protein
MLCVLYEEYRKGTLYAECHYAQCHSDECGGAFLPIHISVTFEMRTVYNAEPFIQLIIILSKLNHFISKQKEGEES